MGVERTALVVCHPSLEGFVEWSRAAGHSKRTIYERLRLVRKLCVINNRIPATIIERDVVDLLAAAKAPATKFAYYGDMRGIFNWMIAAGVRPESPLANVKRPKVRRGRPRPLTDAQLKAALNVATGHVRTMIVLGAREGLRACEIAAMRGDFVYLDTAELRVLGKGGSDEVIPLHPDVAALAKLYPSTGYWFPSPKLGLEHVTPSSVSSVLSRTFKRAQFKAVGHQLRHTYGTRVYKTSGGNLVATQQLLRHVSIVNTQIYVGVDPEDRDAAVAALPSLL